MALLWPSFGLVIDADDRSEGPAGLHYTQKRPLLPAASLRGAED
jgi:hypothetical protein